MVEKNLILKKLGIIPTEKGDLKVLSYASGIIIRAFIYLFLLFSALSAGWLKISCNGGEIIKDVSDILSKEEIHGNIGQIDSSHALIDKDNSFIFIKHTLKSGETLMDIEKLYGTRWQVIKKINNITNETKLEPGRIIFIPVKIKGL